jgi:hypothetical protein
MKPPKKALLRSCEARPGVSAAAVPGMCGKMPALGVK